MKSNSNVADGTGAAGTADAPAALADGGQSLPLNGKSGAAATAKSTRQVGKRPKSSEVGGSVDCIDMLWSALQYCLRDGYAVRMANQDGTPGVVIAVDGFVGFDKDEAGNSRLVAL